MLPVLEVAAAEEGVNRHRTHDLGRMYHEILEKRKGFGKSKNGKLFFLINCRLKTSILISGTVLGYCPELYQRSVLIFSFDPLFFGEAKNSKNRSLSDLLSKPGVGVESVRRGVGSLWRTT